MEKQPRSWNNYQKNIIKCLDIFLQDMRNWNMENDYKAYVKDIKKALKIKKELPDFVE